MGETVSGGGIGGRHGAMSMLCRGARGYTTEMRMHGADLTFKDSDLAARLRSARRKKADRVPPASYTCRDWSFPCSHRTSSTHSDSWGSCLTPCDRTDQSKGSKRRKNSSQSSK